MKITTYKLKNSDYGNKWNEEVEDRWEYNDFKNDNDWRTNWISFDCCLYNENSREVFLGVTSFDGDIFYKFDTDTKKFTCMNFKTIGNQYDAKFHRSLVFNKNDGMMYGAVALLHCVDRFFDAPGGAIVKASPDGKVLEKIAIPMPHIYIQGCDLDEENNKLYLQFFTPEYIGEYDLNSGEFKCLGLAGSGISGMAQGQNILVDSDNNLWGSWCMTRAWQDEPGVDANRIFVKKAKENQISYLNVGLPKTDDYGYNKADTFFDLNDEYIYVSDVYGSLYRINKKTYNVDYMFNPVDNDNARFSAMIKASDGCVYAAVGKNEDSQLIKVDTDSFSYEKVCNLKDKGIDCRQVHHMTEGPDGLLYCCENDNPYRSSYLWEIDIR